jgi:adenylyltransferase/sulfurtransferase
LEGKRGSQTALLCGRNAVQLSPSDRAPVSLESLADKLQGIGKVSNNPYLVRLEVDRYVITVFADGRAIVAGTEEIAEAKTVYARFIGA